MNYLYYQSWTKESLSFSETVDRKCSMKMLRKNLCQSSLATLLKKRPQQKFTCNFIKKETPTQAYLCEFNEIL